MAIPGYNIARGGALAAKGGQMAVKAGLAARAAQMAGKFTLPGAIRAGKQALAPAAAKLASQPGMAGTIGGGISRALGGAKTLQANTVKQSANIIKAAKLGQLEKVGNAAGKVLPQQADEILKLAVRGGVKKGSLAYNKIVSSLPGKTTAELIKTVGKIPGVKTAGRAQKVIQAVRKSPTKTPAQLEISLKRALGIKNMKPGSSKIVNKLMKDETMLQQILTSETAALSYADAIIPGAVLAGAGMMGPNILGSSEQYNPYQATSAEPMMP